MVLIPGLMHRLCHMERCIKLITFNLEGCTCWITFATWKLHVLDNFCCLEGCTCWITFATWKLHVLDNVCYLEGCTCRITLATWKMHVMNNVCYLEAARAG